MLIDCGLVVTPDDWEIKKGVSSRAPLEGMSIAGLIGDGFHLSPLDCFPSTTSALPGIGCVPSRSAFFPLWSLPFFARYVYGKGAPDGSRGAAERQRLDGLILDELVLCLVLGVASERSTNRRTQIMPVEVFNRLLAYDVDCIPTRNGALSVSAT